MMRRSSSAEGAGRADAAWLRVAAKTASAAELCRKARRVTVKEWDGSFMG
jgi:hypothetical protein